MSFQPKKFVQKNGVLTLNPEYIAWKQKNGGANNPKKQQEFVAPIDKMAMEIKVLTGSGLVAKDRNFLGKKTTSDPFVVVSLVSRGQKIQLGKTRTVQKSLSPIWDFTLSTSLSYLQHGPSPGFPNSNPMLMFEIFDEDLMSQPDNMGIVKVMLKWEDLHPSAPTWHEIPKDSAKNASGKIELKISTKVHRMENLRPYC
jgi:Ca2+-dependent lipid-binding protein